jgi:hypothetical protein
MRPKDFHSKLFEIIDLAGRFPKTLWTMFVTPATGFAEALSAENATKMLPGVFLILNLIIADFLISLYWPRDIQKLSLQLVKEVLPSHIIGTLLFLFLLKVFFWKIRATELATVICLASVVYIPYAAVMLAFKFLVLPPFSNFVIFLFSRRYQTPGELVAPSMPILYRGVPLLFIFMVVFVWWLWLLSVGCGRIVPLSRVKRFFRLTLSVSAYIGVFLMIITVVMGYSTYSMIRGFYDHKKMVTSFKDENYAEAFFLASKVSNNEKLLPILRYHAYLIRGISGVKTFSPNDDTFRDAIVAINDKKYRDAEKIMRKEVEHHLQLLDRPMRFLFKQVDIALDGAAKQFNSPAYSESETVPIDIIFPWDRIPINLFPSSL